MLGMTMAHLGYSIFIPRIPPLKELKINHENVDWFIHFYQTFCKKRSLLVSPLKNEFSNLIQ